MTATTRIERSGPSIRAALAEYAPEDCAQFEDEFADALAVAAHTYDLVPLDALLDRWWGIAAIRTNPLSADEQAQVARAKAGDFTGLLERDAQGTWTQL